MRKDIYDNIPGSTPMNYFTGIEDHPSAWVPPRDPLFPIHCPYVPLFTKKGTTKKVYLTAAERALNYGVDSFDPISKYYNEATKLGNIFSKNGNVYASQRVKPVDAPANANYTLFMDVLETNVPLYERNSDGGYKVDVLGDKVSSTTTAGARVKYFLKHNPDGMKFGEQNILPGSMSDGGTTSNAYPIMDVGAKEFGAWYANLGLKIAPITCANLQPEFATVTKALPYAISLFERPDADTTGVVVKSLSGGAYTKVCFKKDAIDPHTEAQLDVDLKVPHNWYNEDPSGSKIKYYDMENIHFYFDNLEKILEKFIALELPHINDAMTTWQDGSDAATLDWFDFTNSSDITGEEHLFNWVTLKSSNEGINYFSVIKDNEVVTPPLGMEEVTIGSDSVLYLRGGGDGTVSLESMQDHITTLMNEYLDGDSEVMSLVMNKETGMYDVGFDLPTKKAMANMIAIRPDTILHYTTFTVRTNNDVPMTVDDEYAVALAIMARAEIFPESEIFATSVCRATIVLGSMEDRYGVSHYRYTQNFELANMLSGYLGALNGKMKGLKALDNARQNTILTLGKDYFPYHIPDSFKTTLWDAGVTYSEPYKINQKAFLAPKTVHTNQQSILSSPIVIYGNAILCRIMDDAHKEFSGNERDSMDVFGNKIVKFCDKKVKGIFDNDRYTIVFEVTWTEADIGRRYSYHLTGKIFGNVMKTAQVTTVATYIKEAQGELDG